jgi:hypothetical protein
MDWFYDGQIRRYLTQFMRVMSNFSYKDGNGRLVQVPVMYGDPSRQAAALLKKNSENTLPSAPFIACYIKSVDYEQTRLQDPTFVSKVHIREREFDEESQQYLETQGRGYTVERIMPSPYKLTFSADIWTTNTDQKLQIFEQLSYLFNPSMELQTTDNYVDWTSLTVLFLKSTTWSSRQVPQGTNQDIDILNMTFETPIWITPPAKVKRMGIITKIIANAFSNQQGVIVSEYEGTGSGTNMYTGLGDPVSRTTVTPGNFELMVLDNVASLLRNNTASHANDVEMPGHTVSWRSLLDLYPGQFRANLTQLRLIKSDGNEVVAYVSLDPLDERRMLLNIDTDTIPTNTVIGARGTIDAIINPDTFNPGTPVTGARYLILENINSTSADGPAAWLQGNGDGFTATANDIIEWTGTEWTIVFNSLQTQTVTYITNIYTGIQYKWENDSWSKSFEGIYDRDAWRIIL